MLWELKKNQHIKYIDVLLCIVCTLCFCTRSLFFSHLGHVIRRAKKSAHTICLAHNQFWCACVSVSVSVTTSLISFNYFNCFYMNNSTIFLILFVMLVCYYCLLTLCWFRSVYSCIHTCETYAISIISLFHFSFVFMCVFVLSQMSIWCDLFHINFDFNSKQKRRDLFYVK